MSDINIKFKEVIERYKERITKTKLKEELYKWELVDKFRGRPNIDAEDFHQEIKSIKFSNLVYAMGIAVINHLAKEKPEELRHLFINLYDENIDLVTRIISFKDKVLKLYRGLGETLQHHQDERSISTYLTYHNSDKYTLYKASYYKKLCNVFEVKEANKNNKYAHYLSLIDDIIENYIKDDIELIELVKSIIPEFYNGSNHKLLVQDILYQMLDLDEEINYWIFQGNPKIFDFKSAIKEETIDTWTVSAHKDKIKKGDKIILWLTGSSSGVYALAEVAKEPFIPDEERDDKFWKEEKKQGLKAGIRITNNLIENPITKEEINKIPELVNLKVGSQGTNFTSTKNEFEKILEMVNDKSSRKYWLYAPGSNANKWDEFYEEEIMALGWDSLGDLKDFKTKQDIANFLIEGSDSDSNQNNNSLANYEFANAIEIGDIIIVKKGRSEYLGYGIVTSGYTYDGTRLEYKSVRKVNWIKKGNWYESNGKNVVKTLTDISKYTDYLERIKQLIGIDQEDKLESKKKTIMYPLNQILYGPPGTGKTYKLQKEFISDYVSKETSITKEQYFENIVSELSWWQVIALALLETGKAKVSDLYENRWIKQKEKNSKSKTIRPTLWGQLQSHTVSDSVTVNVKDRSAIQIFNKTKDSYWEILEDEVKEQAPELYDIKESVDNYNPDPYKEIERYVFTTFHQSFTYEDFIEGIKPVMDEDENSQLSYKIEDGIFKKICIRAENDPENKYAIFIDEINRGNIASIFGELITLIEIDKRKGEENELELILPYSKDKFSVPNNLDIIGTMNTADRSVEALDTALRRRFTFEEMPPKLEILEGKKVSNVSLKDVLKTINKRIEILLDRDHLIGHSFFLNVKNEEDLRKAFAKNILPLLQEHFYGDYGKISLVLGEDFCKGELSQNGNEVFAKISTDYDTSAFEEKVIYTIPDVMDDVEFDIIKAVNLLLNK